jgi:hypothetical protein
MWLRKALVLADPDTFLRQALPPPASAATSVPSRRGSNAGNHHPPDRQFGRWLDAAPM